MKKANKDLLEIKPAPEVSLEKPKPFKKVQLLKPREKPNLFKTMTRLPKDEMSNQIRT
jgi:hypothetical protein